MNTSRNTVAGSCKSSAEGILSVLSSATKYKQLEMFVESFPIFDSGAVQPLKNVCITKTWICRHLAGHVVYSTSMFYCYSLPSSVLLSLGNMASPQGKAHVCRLDLNPLVWSDGRCRDGEYILLVTCVSTAESFDPCSFQWACFFPPFPTRIKCSFKVDYKDYLETWFLYKWV